MRIILAGASGFLGSRLHAHLVTAGHDVVALVRRSPTSPAERRWHPGQGTLDPGDLAGADAVVNLAGAGVNDRRWTAAYKDLLRSSRVDPTATLSGALAKLPESERPALLNASAVGFYGDTGDTAVDEDSPAGEGFFAELCQLWEAATAPAEEAGVRVVRLRTGFPLDAAGGLLKPLLLPFRLGVGGRLAGGRQWMPWLSMRDWLAAVEFLIARREIAGPVNLVGPAPVRNREFARVLAQVLHRPAIVAVPSVALRILVGEFATEALASQRVMPGVLARAGFSFRDPTLAGALRATLAPTPR